MSRQPLLSCSKRADTINVFLVTKKEEGQDRKVYLVGKGFFGGQEVNFEARTLEDNYHKPEYSSWQMKVWESGYTELMTLEDYGYESEDFVCNSKNVFQVTHSRHGGAWEESVTDVKLTLSGCVKDSEKEECDISIESSVGLTWHPSFKPKALFK